MTLLENPNQIVEDVAESLDAAMPLSSILVKLVHPSVRSRAWRSDLVAT